MCDGEKAELVPIDRFSDEEETTDEEDESNSDDEPIVIPRKTKRKTGDGNMGPKPKKLKIPKKQPDARDMNLPKKCPSQVPPGPPPDPLQSGRGTTNRSLLKSHLESSDMSLRSEQAF